VLYKQAQTIARIGSWIYDVRNDRMEWSEELFRIYGTAPGEGPQSLEGTLQPVLPLDRAILTAHIKRCIENLQPYDCHFRIRMGDDSIKSLRAKGEAIQDANGKTVRLFGTIQDITEQMLVERRLRENQRFIQKITDITPSIIAVYNIQDGSYLFINDAVRKLLGYPASRILAEGAAFVITLVHPDDLAPLQEKNNAVLAAANEVGNRDASEEIVSEFKYRLRHSNGSYRWFTTYGTIFERDEEGHVLQVLNISIDVTGQEQAEFALSQKNLQLQQSNASLEEFAYIASHDLQEPLRKISTFGNMLETLQEGDLSPSGKLYLKKIVDSSIRMQSMINDLLSVSIIAGNKAFAPESLQTLLEEVLNMLDHKIEQTGASVIVEQPLPEAPVVAAQFRQLFQNLIGNSLKFSRKDVPNVITISHDYLTRDEALSFGFDTDTRYLRLRLSDCGIGFSNNYAGKIFAIFQRLHGKSEYEGTGIGLAICKKIVEHHKGIIFATGEPDKGALFTIIVPA
jgi:PAS domain S-box-containing protein